MVYLLIYKFKLTLAIRNQAIKIIKTHHGSKNLNDGVTYPPQKDEW